MLGIPKFLTWLVGDKVYGHGECRRKRNIFHLKYLREVPSPELDISVCGTGEIFLGKQQLKSQDFKPRKSVKVRNKKQESCTGKEWQADSERGACKGNRSKKSVESGVITTNEGGQLQEESNHQLRWYVKSGQPQGRQEGTRIKTNAQKEL